MQILPNIKSPGDVRKLSRTELRMLSEEIRDTIIGTVAENGGHLASNLGVVEMTIALHTVFDCPKDTIVFDVGHQCYAHKLLTGRYEQFETLRRRGGISGFTNREESPYDTTTAGHSGSALSAAIGIAEAKRIAGDDSWTVAVVGDGSFTNGMVYEALNNLDNRELRLVFLLNDNEMSISKNVGSLSRYLSYIRTSEGYFGFKMVLRKVFSRIPLIGKGLIHAARYIRDTLKRLTNSETFFENLGLKYIGPVSGNDIDRMISVLEEAKTKNSPVIVHAITRKGLGYSPAQEHPERFHSTGGFALNDTDDGVKPVQPTPKSTFTAEFSRLICEKAEENGRICAVTAAMTDGCGLAEFAKRFPDRFFDTGIAEEHAITMAGGLSIGGMLPVVVMYSTFSQRVFDQLWHDVILQKTPMILMLSHSGLVPGDGVTHQGIYDVGLFARLPGVHIYSPDTYDGLRKSFNEAERYGGLSIIRYPESGEAVYDIAFEDCGSWKKAVIGENAEKTCIVTYGRIAGNVIKAAKRLNEMNPSAGFTAAVSDRICPLPMSDLAELCRDAERVIFVEEVLKSGGIGESFAAEIGRKVEIIAVEDGLLPHGTVDELMKLTGLDVDSLTEKLK
ncbi:MAG: 1-deoxy-D-xylulose-5-phosphate synthase [Clostridia bacterium]|nr:1-deoxy-D-xylulose-5-phosphate synthase [Clostridia bacterium]